MNKAIEELIDKADEYVWIISPYICLHHKVKNKLQRLKRHPEIHLVVVFGKNEDDVCKSISTDDIMFLKEFPNVTIYYERRLHAKFYSSEDFSILTSMNLHQFSQSNNIEAGVKLRSKKWFNGSGDNATEKKAYEYFEKMLDYANIIFDKEPVYKRQLLGLKETYSHSSVWHDDTNNYFKQDNYCSSINYKRRKQYNEPITTTGYCIRTGKPIPFNPQKPLCKDAFESWAQFGNKDYKEKFCHRTGKPSFGKTSMRNPIL